jgi:hypothetical protein
VTQADKNTELIAVINKVFFIFASVMGGLWATLYIEADKTYFQKIGVFRHQFPKNA